MNAQDWQTRTKQLNGQVAAITGRDFQLWVFTFVVVLVLAAGIILVGLSNLAGTGVSRSSHGSATGLMLLVLIFTSYVVYKRRNYISAREELIREIIYSEKVQSLSLIDPLTQAFNICYLDRVLPHEISRANRQGTTISFMLVEVAGWAKVLKEKGELVSDQMLIEAAQFLRKTFRGSDIVLRYDIQRFLVIMTETNELQAGYALERMINRLDFWHLESNAPFELDLRVGLAAYSWGADLSNVLKLAEDRLQSSRPRAKADHLSPDLASYPPQTCNSRPPRISSL